LSEGVSIEGACATLRDRKTANKPPPNYEGEINRREQQIEVVKDRRWIFIDSKHFQVEGSDRIHKVETDIFCENTGKTLYRAGMRQFHKDRDGIFREI